MKRENKLTALLFGLLVMLFSLIPSAASAQYDDVSLETFYEELSPYGVWIDDPQYGKVWRPDVDQEEFRPYYTRGRWEMTKYGNTWVSDYEWGWAPFHYGRWHHHNRRGWVWIPGREWAPAWVSWRSGGGHYGWAPLGPGININISIGRIPDFYWVFVPQRHIYYTSFPRYNRHRNVNIYHNTTIINNVYVYNNRNRYFVGPRAEEIRRVTRQPVVVHDVRRPRPDRGSINANRPEQSERTPSRVDRGQTPRPDRGSVTGRSDIAARPERAISSRPEQTDRRTEERRISTSPPRIDRGSDNPEVRRMQSPRSSRESTPGRSAAVSRSAESRGQRAERPQSRDNGRMGRQAESRSGSSGNSDRGSGGRPSRTQ